MTSRPALGAEERHLARGAFLQQATQIWGAFCMLIVVTVVARHVGTPGFGLYTLLMAFSAVLVTAQISVEGATIRRIAIAGDDPRDRSTAYSTVFAMYLAAGLTAGVLMATAGLAIVGFLNVPPTLIHEAHDAVLGLAIATSLGWPAKAAQDALRARQLFGAASAAQAASFATVAIGVVALTLAGAPLWTLITLGGSLGVLTGFWSVAVARLQRVPYRFRSGHVSRSVMIELVRSSAYLLATGVADLVVYSLDGVILAAFRGARAVGLYGAAARPESLLRQINGTLQLTVVPVAGAYYAAGDLRRVRDLTLRGTRYVMAVVAPLTVVTAGLAGPLLQVWLGRGFRAGAPALVTLSIYWLFGSGTGVGGSMLVAAGKFRLVALYAWSVAISNLLLSIVLTNWFGLEGVVLGTTIPYLVAYPFFTAIMVRELPVTIGQLARQAWFPAWVSAAAAAAVVIPVRIFAAPTNVPGLLGAGLAGLVAAGGTLWAAFLTPAERHLARSVGRNLLRPRDRR